MYRSSQEAVSCHCGLLEKIEVVHVNRVSISSIGLSSQNIKIPVTSLVVILLY